MMNTHSDIKFMLLVTVQKMVVSEIKGHSTCTNHVFLAGIIVFPKSNLVHA